MYLEGYHFLPRRITTDVKRGVMLLPMLSRSVHPPYFLCVAPLFAAPGTLFSQTNPEWTTPFPPHRMIGNVYYVGSKDLAAFLITTPQGHILINSNLESSPRRSRRASSSWASASATSRFF